jgi:hypothetical protein
MRADILIVDGKKEESAGIKAVGEKRPIAADVVIKMVEARHGPGYQEEGTSHQEQNPSLIVDIPGCMIIQISDCEGKDKGNCSGIKSKLYVNFKELPQVFSQDRNNRRIEKMLLLIPMKPITMGMKQ